MANQTLLLELQQEFSWSFSYSKLGLPFIYVRSSTKDHGRQNLEAKIDSGHHL